MGRQRRASQLSAFVLFAYRAVVRCGQDSVLGPLPVLDPLFSQSSAFQAAADEFDCYSFPCCSPLPPAGWRSVPCRFGGSPAAACRAGCRRPAPFAGALDYRRLPSSFRRRPAAGGGHRAIGGWPRISFNGTADRDPARIRSGWSAQAAGRVVLPWGRRRQRLGQTAGQLLRGAPGARIELIQGSPACRG